MAKCLLFFLVSFSFIACQSTSKNETLPPKAAKKSSSFISKISLVSEKSFDVQAHQEKYKGLKKRIRAKLQYFASHLRHPSQAKRELAEEYFFHTLVDSVFPYWYGTDWDFNGFTENPRDGKIACGYFVSTTLRDMGLNINRYKIAQKAALDILKTFTRPHKIQKFSDFEKMTAYLSSSKENEIFILGLDYHVGFIIRKDQKLFFIHSNYFGDSKVEKEAFENSYSAQSSQLFYVGSLSKNEQLYNKWISGI